MPRTMERATPARNSDRIGVLPICNAVLAQRQQLAYSATDPARSHAFGLHAIVIPALRRDDRCTVTHSRLSFRGVAPGSARRAPGGRRTSNPCTPPGVLGFRVRGPRPRPGMTTVL